MAAVLAEPSFGWCCLNVLWNKCKFPLFKNKPFFSSAYISNAYKKNVFWANQLPTVRFNALRGLAESDVEPRRIRL
jgi:hypothetical protein